MTSIHEHANGWHPGEQAIHKLLRVPTGMRENPTSLGLPASYGYRVAMSSLLALGALDESGRPWTTVLGGERGFARPIAQGIIAAQTLVDRKYDPVVQALIREAPAGELVRPDEHGGPRLMAGLSIDFETRDRVKLAGKMVVGAIMPRPGPEGEQDDQSVGEAQFAMAVTESLGNCPKYINQKDIVPHVPSPELVSGSLPLPQEALDLIEKADLLFISSTNGETMDTNHRGGPQGFIRVLTNSSADGVTLVYPEYSGNRLYQTLGNLHTNPRIGVAIPDFDTSDVLYLTGTTDLLVGPAASAVQPHSKLIVKIHVEEARFVRDGLPFRGARVEQSPYNPPVRRLANEVSDGATQDASTAAVASARLVKREPLAPTVARFTFELEPVRGRQPPAWRAGQHVTLDFSEELDQGWSHMRDDDPSSLNDDFVRTFTVSNALPEASILQDGTVKTGTKLEITVRKHGPSTTMLWRHNTGVPLTVPILGFAGEQSFRMPTSEQHEERPIFVAAGVGITPLLAQAAGVLAAEQSKTPEEGLHVLWSLRGEDLGLAVDTLERIPGLAPRTHVYITGKKPADEAAVEKVKSLGAQVTHGRLTQGELLAPAKDATNAAAGTKAKFYVCTSPEMHKTMLTWLAGQDVVSESFNY